MALPDYTAHVIFTRLSNQMDFSLLFRCRSPLVPNVFKSRNRRQSSFSISGDINQNIVRMPVSRVLTSTLNPYTFGMCSTVDDSVDDSRPSDRPSWCCVGEFLSLRIGIR